jgi:hypothetical protein
MLYHLIDKKYQDDECSSDDASSSVRDKQGESDSEI